MLKRMRCSSWGLSLYNTQQEKTPQASTLFQMNHLALPMGVTRVEDWGWELGQGKPALRAPCSGGTER